MHQWLTALLNVACLLQEVFSRSVFNHHIKIYETVECHLFGPEKSNLPPSNEFYEYRLKYDADAEVQFRAFNMNFHLLLYEDFEYKNVEIMYHFNNSLQSNQLKSKFYEGIVKESSLNSAVVGYLYDDVFSGCIRKDEITYFIEPATLFFSKPNHSSKIVVYRSEDIVNSAGYKTSQKMPLDYSINRFAFPFITYRNRQRYPQGINKNANTTIADYACEIEMVADHTLYEYFKEDTDAMGAFLYLHGKYADFIFRRTDFDGDGLPDNIRIVIKKMSFYKTPEDPNYPMAKAKDLVTFLNKFTERSQNYCISFCLCYRNYRSSTAVGQAFRPEPYPYPTPGGICQFPIWHRGIRRYLNTGVVTILNSRNEIMPLITTLLAVTHEIGHSFGSDHDPLNDLYCSPGGMRGYYLMYPKTSKVFKPLNSHFSPCSRKEIRRVIIERGECLKVHPSVCGNGVREGDEECDCGWGKSCPHLDGCCTPSDAKPPEKGCTFRNGSDCSPKESKCCKRDCTVIKDNGTECYKSDIKCMVSHCDGVNATCPKAKPSPDKYACLQTSKTCHHGYCNSTVCVDNNLRDCACNNSRFVCYVCCQKDNSCLPAEQLNLTFPYGNVFMSLEGTRCKSGNFQCDGAGRCVDVKSRNIQENNGQQRVVWWMLVVLSVVLFTLCLIFCYLLRKHTTS